MSTKDKNEALRQSQSLPAGDEVPVAWWNGARESKLDDSLLPSVSWTGENTHHDIPLFAGCNPHSEIVRKAAAYDALQSLPAGAVAGLVGKWRDEAQDTLRYHSGHEAHDIARAFKCCATDLEQALQADAREKGEVVAWQWRYAEDPSLWFDCSRRVFDEMSEYQELYETRALITATQPAQASEKMTGAVPDTLPEFLEWVATQLLLRDTKAGTFAPGVSASLRGRAYILRTVEESK